MLIKLRETRVQLGMTQEELAGKVGVSRQTINYIERGKYKPTVILALKIAKVLNKNVEEIFVLEGSDWE
ncbi:MAG: helix-turn-helix transcriptional regulator [Thermotogaceae bacterium]|nr:helix-turn-helix transcriptional regulator [Thermotogaceae bacterium]